MLLASTQHATLAIPSPVRPQNARHAVPLISQPAHFTGLSTAAAAASRRPRLPPCLASSSSEEDSPTSSADAPGPRDDDALPDSLTDALVAASEATALAMDRGCERSIVEILLPEFWDPQSGPIYAEEGDQQRFWKLTRRFIDNMVTQRPAAKLRAIYPDAGVAAMLRSQWASDAAFSISSLNDRKPVEESDEIIVLAAPDPPGLDYLIKISNALLPGQCLVLFNPRLASGDVGVGLTMRRLRDSFLKQFVTTYSLRPVGDVGSVFRRYPGMWQVFVQDPEVAGRYKLAAERPSRPGGEALDLIIVEALGGKMEGEQGATAQNLGLGDQIALTVGGLQRFMRSLSR